MIKLLPLLFLLVGCSVPPEKPNIILKIMRSHVEMDIKIEDDFSRFGRDVNGYTVCAGDKKSKKDYCILILPEITARSSKHDFCTWGTMLAFIVYGEEVLGKEKIDVCNRR